MQLCKHTAQGKLLYLHQSKETLSVSENEHYRWLAFTDNHNEGVIQSIMLKRKPWQLTLPHQTLILLPLLFFTPKTVVELGLGGGNLQRFLTHLSSNINILSIEQNSHVISCFHRFFNPENNLANILHLTSNAWLAQTNKEKPDWLICDIYQSEHQSNCHITTQLQSFVDNIDDYSCLSINLPEANNDEINLCLTILRHLCPKHQLYYFHTPNYLNIIIHVVPKYWPTTKLVKANADNLLPPLLFNKWKNFWRYRNEVR